MEEKVFKVMLELEIQALDHEDAAERADGLVKELFEEFIYTVQDPEEEQIVTVDLYSKRLLGSPSTNYIKTYKNSTDYKFLIK